MRSARIAILLKAFAAMVSIALAAAAATGQSAVPAWPQWRGPIATGEAPAGDPPIEWSETRNVRWKTPIPGASTPIIWRHGLPPDRDCGRRAEGQPANLHDRLPEDRRKRLQGPRLRPVAARAGLPDARHRSRHGRHPALETLAVNHLDDGFDASPAVVGDELYLRGRESLYRISSR
jgi:hypothetical protein